MAPVLGRVNGPMLRDNLVRNGINLAFESSLLYFDVVNSRIGVNTAVPAADFDVGGLLTVSLGASTATATLTGSLSTTSLTSGTMTVTTATVTNLSSDNITGTFSGTLSGDGSGITSIPAASLTGTVAEARLSGSYSGITAVGTLPLLTVGDLTATKVITPLVESTGSITLKPGLEDILVVDSTKAVLMPSGSTANRPATPIAGMLRFNSSADAFEFYSGGGWLSFGSDFTTVRLDTFYGNNVTDTFTLTMSTTTNGALVSVNGAIQVPGTSYTITGNQITFAEPLYDTDVAEVRSFVTTSSVKSISDGTSYVEVTDALGDRRVDVGVNGEVRLRVTDVNVQVNTPFVFDSTAIVVGTTATVIDSFDSATYRTAKYTVQVSNGTTHEIFDLILIHNGTTITLTTVSNVRTGGSLGAVSTAMNGATVELRFTGSSANNSVKVVKSYIKV